MVHPPKLEFLMMDFAIPSDFSHLGPDSADRPTAATATVKRRLITANGHLLCRAASSRHKWPPLKRRRTDKSEAASKPELGFILAPDSLAHPVSSAAPV